jgi:amino acid permease
VSAFLPFCQIALTRSAAKSPRSFATPRSLIPITEAMKEPQKFPHVLSGCMVFVATLFTGFGVMGYMAYGSDIQTVVMRGTVAAED